MRLFFALALMAATPALFISNAPLHSSEPVLVEYFYLPSCPDCQRMEPIIEEIARNYGEQINVEWVDVSYSTGWTRWNHYNFTYIPAVAVNHEYCISSNEITKDKLESIIEAYIYGKTTDATSNGWRYLNVPSVFLFGILSGFSPCLMAILVFILISTANTSCEIKDGFWKALAFSTGLMTAYLILGVFVLVLGGSIQSILGHSSKITWVASAILVLTGINLLGILRFPIDVKPTLQNLARRFGTGTPGFFAFGILFSCIKLPCAVPFLLVILSNIVLSRNAGNLVLLLAYTFGVIIPFIALGLIGGVCPGIVQKIRGRYRRVFRIINGLVLIGFALWLLIS